MTIIALNSHSLSQGYLFLTVNNPSVYLIESSSAH